MTITAPDGAYIIGGGEYHFGQAVTEELARAAFEFPMPTLSNMIELLRSVLELLPLDALKPFKGFLGLDDAHFGTIVDAVNNIISSLQQRPIFMLLTDFTSWVKDLVQAITGIANGDLSMLTTWFQSNVVDQITNIVAGFQLFLDGIWSFFSGNGFVAGKTVSDALAALTNWVNTTFKGVSDGLTAIVKTVTDLIDGFFKLFGGKGTGTLADMITAATSWMTHWQEFVDGIWSAFSGGVAGVGKTVADALAALKGWFGNFHKLLDALFGAFGGVAGTDKTITDVIGAITGWFTNVFQKLIDGVNALASLIPGFSTESNPIQNVVNIITGILGIGQSAATAAATANIKILALEAANKKGFSDEFDYAKANVLPSPWTNTGNKLWGPSGKGILEYLGPNGIGGGGQQVYKQPTNPIVGATGTISVGLWKPPHTDFAVKSHVGLNAQVSLTDSSCLQWWIEGDRAELRVLDGAGNATRQGTLQIIPRLAAGDVLEMSWTATESKLKVNDIVQATRPWTGTLAGQHIGLTLQTGGYTWLGSSNHPAPEISGIAWHP
jgi:hypothetical protein